MTVDGVLSLSGLEDVAEIGRGGFATVYRARQQPFGRWVAVKVLDVGAEDDTARRRFERECQSLGRLSEHPSIVSVYDGGTLPDGRFYLVMGFVPGGSLAARIGGGERLSWPVVAAIGMVLASALQFAHDSGVVHCDIKPANILLNPDIATPLIADFGIATLSAGDQATVTSSFSGTPSFLPPEALDGEQPEPRRDVYSLAATMHCALTGSLPFAGADGGLYALMKRIANEPPAGLERFGVPVQLAEVILRAMAKDPDDRPQTAALFGQELSRAVGLGHLVQATSDVRRPPSESDATNDRPTDVQSSDATLVSRNRLADANAVHGATAARIATARPSIPPDRPVGGAIAVSITEQETMARVKIEPPPPPRSRRGIIGGGIAAAALLIAGGVVMANREPRTTSSTPTTTTGKGGPTTIGSTVPSSSLPTAARTSPTTVLPATTSTAPPVTVPAAGDGGPATAAALSAPNGMAAGPDGSIYVADTGHHRIRRIAPDGTMSTFAGVGTQGLSGDGQIAVAAQLNAPLGVTAAADGTVYIADTGNHRVRRVGRDGIITTLAGSGLGPGDTGDGGQGVRAMLAWPTDVAIAKDGSLLFTERARIRRLTADGTITVFAGRGEVTVDGDGGPAVQAGMINPTGLEVALDGSVIFQDVEAGRVRKVTPDGLISTIGGNGDCCGQSDGKPAVAASIWQARDIALGRDGSIFLTEGGTNTVRRIGPEGIITTIAGIGTADFQGDGALALRAAFTKPGGVLVGPGGQLYIADTGNNRIRVLSGDGIISTFAGTGAV